MAAVRSARELVLEIRPRTEDLEALYYAALAAALGGERELFDYVRAWCREGTAPELARHDLLEARR